MTDEHNPTEDLATCLRALANKATTYDKDDPDHYVNQWRVTRSVSSERPPQFGIDTGRVDWPMDIIDTRARMREEDARLIAALFNHRHLLIDALEQVYGPASETDPNPSRPKFFNPSDRLGKWDREGVTTVTTQTYRPQNLRLIDEVNKHEWVLVDGKWVTADTGEHSEYL